MMHPSQRAADSVLSPLASKVEKWLELHGYPFELDVGRQLREIGFHHVDHGHFYRDPRTKKWREIDIIAKRYIYAMPPGVISAPPPIFLVRLVIECKFSSKPWVVLASNAGPGALKSASSFLLGRITRAVVQQAELPITADNELLPSGLKLAAFGFRGIAGHGVVEANLGSKPARRNVAYNAVRSVLGASAALTAGQGRGKLNPTFNKIVLTLPVIVCGGPLFALSLDDSGTKRLDEIDGAALAGPSGAEGHSSMLVRIVRPREPLRKLVTEAFGDAERLLAILAPQWDLIVAKLSKPFGDAA